MNLSLTAPPAKIHYPNAERAPRTHTHSHSHSHSEDGQTTVVMALVLATFLFGFVAMGIDCEVLFRARRQAQSAADAAAIAAAEEYSNGSASEYAAAVAAAKLNGFDTTLATDPATVSVPAAPTTGSYSGNSGYIQEVVSEPVPVFFAGLVTHTPTVTISARAVAGAGQTSPTCLCLEGPSGIDLNVSGNAKLNPANCGTTVDSSSSAAIELSGNSTLGGLAIGSISPNWYPSEVTGNASVLSGTKVIQGISTACGPPLPTVPTFNSSQCTANPGSNYNGNASYSIGPGSTYSTTQSGGLVCYTSFSASGNQTVNINSGIYVIDGGALSFSGNVNTTGGSGVFIYLVNGASLSISGNVGANLTAMTSGTYAGTVIYQDSADSNAMTISGNANTSINGAIYAPSAALTLSGNSETIDADLVAKTLNLSGNTNLNSTAATNFGSLNTSVAKLTE